MNNAILVGTSVVLLVEAEVAYADYYNLLMFGDTPIEICSYVQFSFS